MRKPTVYRVAEELLHFRVSYQVYDLRLSRRGRTRAIWTSRGTSARVVNADSPRGDVFKLWERLSAMNAADFRLSTETLVIIVDESECGRNPVTGKVQSTKAEA